MSLKNLISVVSGGSRGIGKQIAIDLAKQQSHVFILGKTLTDKDSKLEGSLNQTKMEIKNNGGTCTTLKVDLRNPDQINQLSDYIPSKVDILINNASAITPLSTCNIDQKKYKLINDVNTQGTFNLTKCLIPNLLKSTNPKVINISPPLNFNPEWYRLAGVPYTVSKLTMSLYALGWSQEYINRIAFNCIWPEKIIKSAAIEYLLGEKGLDFAREPDIMSNAVLKLLEKDIDYTGNFLLDSELIHDHNDLNEKISDYYVGNPSDLISMMKNLNK